MWGLLSHSRQLIMALLVFLMLSAVADGGFIAGTLVKTPSGYVKIEYLREQDTLVCYDFKNSRQKNCDILSIRKKIVLDPVVIELFGQKIVAASNQKIYFPKIKQWLDVFTLKNYKLFCCGIESTYDLGYSIECYEISVKECHNFYITTEDILVHNVVLPVVVAFIGASVPTIISSIATLGAGALVIGSSLLRRKKSRNDYLESQEQDFNRSGSPGNQDPEDSEGVNFFERIKARADKKARTKRFGNVYRDPETKLWWSKDRANHGGSAYKVFKEGSKGLEWLFDADVRGNPIVGKHKGPIGFVLPYKDLILCH